MANEILTRSEVMAIPSPAFTKSWHPWSHRDIINSLTTVLESEKIGVIAERYSAKKDGANLFGAWTLDIGTETQVQLGFRNSVCKSFLYGVCSGTHVVVCSNMCFSGEFVEFRKHTGRLDFDELLEIGARSIKKVVDDGKKMITWQNDLHQFELDEIPFKALTYDAMEEGVIAPQNFHDYLEAWNTEVETSKERTMYEFHGAVTRMIREKNLFIITKHTKSLNSLCDRYINCFAD